MTEIDPSGDEVFVVVAFMQPFKLDGVSLALAQIDAFHGMTVSECRGFSGDYSDGHQGPVEAGGGGQHRRLGEQGPVDLAAGVRLEIVVRGAVHAGVITDTIARVAHTGRPGDGLVYSAQLSSVLRIRTMQAGPDAI